MNKTCENCTWYHLTYNEITPNITKKEYYDKNYTPQIITEKIPYCLRLDLWFSDPEHQEINLQQQAEECNNYKKKKINDIITYD